MDLYAKLLKEARIARAMGFCTRDYNGGWGWHPSTPKNVETLLINLRRQDEHRGARGA